MTCQHLALPLLLLIAGVSTAAEPLVVSVDAKASRPEIHPFIYGQFIEHLGRCVYGGIWAEMLEDRKFYFPVTADYAPYKSLTETDYPVVGASPWQIVGDAAGVAMQTDDAFVGEQTPRLAPGAAIRQNDLGVVAGKAYVGYVWLKAPAATSVAVSLDTGDGEAASQTFAVNPDGYQKHAFRFTAARDSDKASLTVHVVGKAPALVGTVSLMPADNVRGMRADTLALLKKLNAPVYRWPGGNFVSGYDWRDGIGDRDRRPPRKNPAWTGVEHNDVGVDEFIDFCREVGAEPMIAANTGFGDAYSAAQEVEYCNGGGDTIGGSWRVKNGSAEPYNVKYWCVGNEMFGAWQLGFMQLAQYTQKHNLVAAAMRKADPSLVLVGVGELDGRDPEHDPDRKYGWSEGMLRECAGAMDLLSEHFYVGQTPWTKHGPLDSIATHVDEMRQAIRKKAQGHRELQDRLGLVGERRMPIAMDEWNYWHRDYVYGELGCRYDLADALGVAVGLHEYYRSSDIIQMAHYAQTVNVIGCIKTTKTDAFLDTTALPLMVYREHFGVRPVGVEVDADQKALDVVAALTEDGGVLTVGVVNTTDKPQPLRVEAAGLDLGGGKAWCVRGDDPRATNDAAKARVGVESSTVDSPANWEAPAYSFTVLRFAVK